MDLFVEKLVRRKKSPMDIAYTILLILVALAGSYFALLYATFISPLIIAGLFYLAYYLASQRNIEFEYAITNGDVDIDMIVNQRKRSRVFSANCRNFEVVARVNSEQYTPQIRNTKTVLNFSSRDPKADVWFIYLIQNSTPKVILFEPDEQIIDSFRTFIPRKVFK